MILAGGRGRACQVSVHRLAGQEIVPEPQPGPRDIAEQVLAAMPVPAVPVGRR